MSEKRFKLSKYVTPSSVSYFCDENGRMLNKEVVDLLNEQQATINKKKELLKLIANACSFNKEHSVKEILRNEIKGIDTVTYESANAWHDYVLLSEFFEECYGEHWDND